MSLNEYEALRVQGRNAEAVINGVLRGGFVLNGTFYAHAGKARGIVSAPVSNVSSLKYL